ncbi:formate dehydrogenase subunit alpha [Roseateles saccharophilus]|uniref:Formate dehydrogenase major subunit n=1 Tax=Roseateles saccharophilus TaxID=304 RepID=A0A4R3VDQ6_ROSSA|nr:formate dehydrogenase subunit alpha [Roseateles saccharophilus]MDG0832068.1 formate dehydrogenase subunit alpha [Roseateles saccharophilus]TCV03476.1 formate dehydrogenase major subunit [Roseateles saccharophilus]
MTGTTKLTVDGQPQQARSGDTILSLLQGLGIAPPALCSDPRIQPGAHCRLCCVELQGQEHPVTSCNTRVAEGMRIVTSSPALERYRHQLLEWMAQSCSSADLQGHPDKALHRELRRHGLAPGDAEPAPRGAVDESHPLIRFNPSRCITCYRCVRICEELQGQSVWHVLGHGAGIHIVPDSGGTLAASSCVACGACVDTCPTTALLDRPGLGQPPAERWTHSVCAYCGVGCEIEVGTAADAIVSVRPVLDAPVNKGHLCAKGRNGHAYERSPERVRQPLLRQEDGQWQASGWSQALDAVAQRLRRVIDTHGPDAVGVLGSARATNEDNYLVQKFARLVIGTHNVDCCARVCHTPSAAAMKMMLGTGAATNSFDDIELARCFLIVGANPSESHPVVGARIKQRLLRGAAQAIVIDPRRTELARQARLHLALRPGTNVPLLNAMAHVIVEEGLFDAGFVAARVEGLEALRSFLQAWTPERAAAICGVPAAQIREAARLYAGSGPAMCLHGLGVTEHSQGTEGVMCLINLALLTGNLGRRGAGINPLRGQNNVQGAALMGCEPGTLTGSQSLEASRARFEAAWQAPLPHNRGLNLLEMMDAAEAGRLKALYVVGFDIDLSLAHQAATRSALRKLDLLVVQDLFLNETARQADVFLPAASSFEKEGSFMNAERRVQRVRRSLPPLGEARPDWQILCELAAAMGLGEHFNYADAESIWNEVRAVWPDGAGLSYARLGRGGLLWPCRDEADPGQAVLHTEGFANGPTATLRVVDYRPSAERTDAEFPFLLSTGRNLYQFNAGTMSGRGPLSDLRATDTLDMNPADAARLAFADGELLQLRSRHGCAELPLRISGQVQPGQLFASFHDPAVALNRVTSPERDSIVQAPEYKLTAAQVARAGQAPR